MLRAVAAGLNRLSAAVRRRLDRVEGGPPAGGVTEPGAPDIRPAVDDGQAGRAAWIADAFARRGGPPAHWLARVLEAAPQLLTGSGDRRPGAVPGLPRDVPNADQSRHAGARPRQEVSNAGRPVSGRSDAVHLGRQAEASHDDSAARQTAAERTRALVGLRERLPRSPAPAPATADVIETRFPKPAVPPVSDARELTPSLLVYSTGGAFASNLISGGPWLAGVNDRNRERGAGRPQTPPEPPGVLSLRGRGGRELRPDALAAPAARAVTHAPPADAPHSDAAYQTLAPADLRPRWFDRDRIIPGADQRTGRTPPSAAGGRDEPVMRRVASHSNSHSQPLTSDAPSRERGSRPAAVDWAEPSIEPGDPWPSVPDWPLAPSDEDAGARDLDRAHHRRVDAEQAGGVWSA